MALQADQDVARAQAAVPVVGVVVAQAAALAVDVDAAPAAQVVVRAARVAVVDVVVKAAAKDLGLEHDRVHVYPFPVNEPELWAAYVPEGITQYLRLF